MMDRNLDQGITLTQMLTRLQVKELSYVITKCLISHNNWQKTKV